MNDDYTSQIGWTTERDYYYVMNLEVFKNIVDVANCFVSIEGVDLSCIKIQARGTDGVLSICKEIFSCNFFDDNMNKHLYDLLKNTVETSIIPMGSDMTVIEIVFPDLYYTRSMDDFDKIGAILPVPPDFPLPDDGSD